MNPNPQRLPDYLGHILEAIENILSYTEGMDEAGFMEAGLTKDAVMRNRITHGYFNVDYSVVWKTIQEDLPLFHQRVQQILKQEFA